MKFGRPTQNGMPMTTKWSELKPEVKIQCDVRLFSKTGHGQNKICVIMSMASEVMNFFAPNH